MLINRRDLLKSVSSFALLPALPKPLQALGDYEPISGLSTCVRVVAVDQAYDGPSYRAPLLKYVSYVCGSHCIETPEVDGMRVYVKCKEKDGLIKTAVALVSDGVILDRSPDDKSMVKIAPQEFDVHESHFMAAKDHTFMVEFGNEADFFDLEKLEG